MSAALGTTEGLEVLGPLGSGGMADVFLVRRRGSGELLALKRVRSGLGSSPEAKAQFEREASIGLQLTHPNVVAVFGQGCDAAGGWIAMEYVPGASASALVRACAKAGGALPLPAALCIALDVAEGLSYLHAHEAGGIVHRDVTPENVLIGRDGTSRLSDFGISRLIDGVQLTRTGQVKGKLGYIAPELLDGSPPSFAADRFSLASSLFWLFTGTRAFNGRTDAELLSAVLYAAPASLLSLRPDVPLPVADWVQGALAKDPAQRPASIDLLRIALAAALRDAPERGRGSVTALLAQHFPEQAPAAAAEQAPTQQSTLDAPPRKGRRSRLWLAPVMGLLVALGWAVTVVRPWVAPARAPAPPPPAEGPEVPPAAPPAPLEAAAVEEPLPSGEPDLSGLELTPNRAQQAHAEKTGRLKVKVAPYAEVFVDGVRKGPTPLAPLVLAAGSHVIILVNPELSARRVMPVNIERGKETQLVVDLRSGATGP